MFDRFQSILNNSKEFNFECGSILVIRDYHTGEAIRLDLSQLDEEAFDSIVVKEDEDYE